MKLVKRVSNNEAEKKLYLTNAFHFGFVILISQFFN